MPAVGPALPSMRVVKEQALRVRSGNGAAPSLWPLIGRKNKGPVPFGNRASNERGRSASAGSFTRWMDVMALTTGVMCIGDRGEFARQLPSLRRHHACVTAQALRAGEFNDGDERAVHGGGRKRCGRRLGLIVGAQEL